MVASRIVVAVLVLLTAACSDRPTESSAGIARPPQAGTLRVSVRTSGGDPDEDGYWLLVNAVPRAYLASDTTLAVNAVNAGTQTLALDGIAENCAVKGLYPRVVKVPPGQTADVQFEIECVATSIAVAIHTTGVDRPTLVDLVVNDTARTSILANASITLSRLKAGTYTVSVVVPDHCSVAANRIAVQVSAGTTTPVSFEVTCVAVQRLEKIAFTRDTTVDGVSQQWIALIDPDGSGEKTLAAGRSPAWSPDGEKLAFSNFRCELNQGYGYTECYGSLVVMDPETRNLFPVSGGIGALDPSWAPMGQPNTVAFGHCCDVYSQPDGLYKLTLFDGSVPAKLTPPGVYMAGDPSWSPDGRRLAFTCWVAQANYDLCVMNSDGTGLVRLTSDVVPDGDPAWSPDGQRIAFTSGGRIALMAPAGGSITVLTDGYQPAWSPDGTRIVFAGSDGLYVIDPGGSNRKRLTAGRHYFPAWRPRAVAP